MARIFPLINWNGDNNLKIEAVRYTNDRIGLQIYDSNNFPYARITVNDPDIELAADEIIIKNYAENTGILEILMSHDIISAPLRYAEEPGMPICKLLITE